MSQHLQRNHSQLIARAVPLRSVRPSLSVTAREVIPFADDVRDHRQRVQMCVQEEPSCVFCQADRAVAAPKESVCFAKEGVMKDEAGAAKGVR